MDGHSHTAAEVGADPAGSAAAVDGKLGGHVGSRSNPHGVTAAQAGAVPTERKVNNRALSADISLTAADVGARPSSWTPTAADVGAAAASHGTHVSYSATSPVMDGAASAGSAATVARSDHRHPVDTSRAAASHTHAASQVTAGTFPATGVKAAAGTDYTTSRVRNICASTTDLTAGLSALSNGEIYLVYE